MQAAAPWLCALAPSTRSLQRASHSHNHTDEPPIGPRTCRPPPATGASPAMAAWAGQLSGWRSHSRWRSRSAAEACGRSASSCRTAAAAAPEPVAGTSSPSAAEQQHEQGNSMAHHVTKGQHQHHGSGETLNRDLVAEEVQRGAPDSPSARKRPPPAARRGRTRSRRARREARRCRGCLSRVRDRRGGCGREEEGRLVGGGARMSASCETRVQWQAAAHIDRTPRASTAACDKLTAPPGG